MLKQEVLIADMSYLNSTLTKSFHFFEKNTAANVEYCVTKENKLLLNHFLGPTYTIYRLN